jgi:hypothetical protein
VTRHESVIASLCEANPHIRTKGFKRALLDEFDRLTGEDIAEHLTWLRLIPDAFEIANGLAVAYEVEDTHRVDHAKMLAYARLWNGLAETETVEFRLVIIDIRGGRFEPDLRQVWLGLR